MDRLEGLRHWATDRPRVAAGIAAGVLVLVAALLVFASGGEDVAPAVGGVADPAAQGTPQATDAPMEPATVAPQEPGTVAAQASVGVAPLTSDGGPAASSSEQRSAAAAEEDLNEGLTPPPALSSGEVGTSPVSTPPVTNADVEFGGGKLELVVDGVDACMQAGRGDVFECLVGLPDEVDVERIFETKPQGARLRIMVGSTAVGLMFRGDVRCRTLGTGTDCNAWSAARG